MKENNGEKDTEETDTAFPTENCSRNQKEKSRTVKPTPAVHLLENPTRIRTHITMQESVEGLEYSGALEHYILRPIK